MENSDDVVIIGGGLTGMVAATIALRETSGKVILVEKTARMGGNSAKATSGINGSETAAQRNAEVGDTVAQFSHDIIRSGQNSSDERLAEALAASSGAAIDFLVGEGINLKRVHFMGGHSAERCHRLTFDDGTADNRPIGFTIVNTLTGRLKLHKRFVFLPNTSVVDMLFVDWPNNKPDDTARSTTQPRAVTGIIVQNNESGQLTSIPCSAVVGASGGFVGDVKGDLLMNYAPHLVGWPTTNGLFSTGDLQSIAEHKGLGLTDMDKIQIHPTTFMDPKDPDASSKFVCAEIIRGCGGFLLNREGSRFTNEVRRRDEVTSEIVKHGSLWSEWHPGSDSKSPSKVAMLVVNDDVRATFGVSNFDFYVSKGFITKVGSFDNLVALFGEDKKSNLERSIAEVLGIHKETTEDPFGRPHMKVEYTTNDVFYVSYITPALHYTMGGLKVNSASQVQVQESPRSFTHRYLALPFEKDGTPVVNFFAAGEVSGGVHGGNRLGGNGLTDSVVFGMQSGRKAAITSQYMLKESTTALRNGVRLSERFPFQGGHWLTFSLDAAGHVWTAPIACPLYIIVDGVMSSIPVYAATPPYISTPGFVDFYLPNTTDKVLDKLSKSKIGQIVKFSASCEVKDGLSKLHTATYDPADPIVSTTPMHISADTPPEVLHILTSALKLRFNAPPINKTTIDIECPPDVRVNPFLNVALQLARASRHLSNRGYTINIKMPGDEDAFISLARDWNVVGEVTPIASANHK